jgi:hypothetical protein
MRRTVDVFVKDRLRGSYPVVIEGAVDPSDDDFIDCVRTRLDRGAYSADDVKAARFVVREASSGFANGKAIRQG